MSTHRRLSLWLTRSSRVLLLTSAAAGAHGPCSDCATSRAQPPLTQASLDGVNFEPIPLKRAVRDPLTGQVKMVVVPPSKYRSMRWTFAAVPAPDNAASAPPAR